MMVAMLTPRRTLSSVNRASAVAGVSAALLPVVSPLAAWAQVSVQGGRRSDNPYAYEWQVTNHGATPVTYFEIPQFRANIFYPPTGWSTESLVHLNARRAEPFVCRAVDPRRGIRQGRSVTFGLTVPAGAQTVPGPATVIIGLADGSRLEVAGIESPLPEAAAIRHVGLISGAVIFAVFLLVQILRGRKRSRRSALAENRNATPLQ